MTAKNSALRDELRMVKRALVQAGNLMEQGEEDFTKLGGLIARLCDTAARLQLARLRLQAGEDGAAKLRAEMDEILSALGLGEASSKE